MADTNNSQLAHLQDLILVAGHAAFLKETQTVPDHPERDDGWFLQPFQIGEPPFYIEHIRRGVVLAANNPSALLLFSGGYTREQAGLHWSEAQTYLEIAQHFKWWVPDKNPALRHSIETRTRTENYARDSFENLLFGVCEFRDQVGRYPRNVTVVSWKFKRARFEFHSATIHFPPGRFCFDGFNDPLLPQWENEAKTLRDFIESRFGNRRTLGKKRNDRNPFDKEHNYAACPGMEDYFAFIEKQDPPGDQPNYPGRLPWED